MTSINHVPQKAKLSQQISFFRRQNSPGRYFASGGKIDKSAYCLASHGWASLKKNKCPWSMGG